MKRNARLAAHIESLYSCRACPNVFGTPVTGIVGPTQVMLVGQAPGVHEVEDPRPFVYTAGRRLFSWFRTLGVSEERFRETVHIAAVIRCFPGKDPKGGDRVPSPEEIARCGEHLDREIGILGPKLIIAVGTLSASELLGERELKNLVGRLHRASRAGKSFDVVVLPHPSGRSTWLNKPENARLLDQSLQQIARHPAFVKAFDAGNRQQAIKRLCHPERRARDLGGGLTLRIRIPNVVQAKGHRPDPSLDARDDSLRDPCSLCFACAPTSGKQILLRLGSGFAGTPDPRGG